MAGCSGGPSEREETSKKDIHTLVTKDGEPTSFDGDKNILGGIAQWVKGRDISAVIWTGLKSNFPEKAGSSYSSEAAISYLKNLSGMGRTMAIEYICRAPEFVDTKLICALREDSWFQEQVRLWKAIR